MARYQIKICDICKKPIAFPDDRVLDFLEREYPTNDICPDCDTQLQLDATVRLKAKAAGVTPHQYLQQWLDLYENTNDE